MIDTVVTLATNYGHESEQNTVGTISKEEAKESLRIHKGSIWAAVTTCIEQRQKKVMDIIILYNQGYYNLLVIAK